MKSKKVSTDIIAACGMNCSICMAFLASFFFITTAVSQISYEGKIINTRTKKPVPYASFRIKHEKIQAVANADGRFVLNADLFKDYDTVIISCVGFHPKQILLKSIGISAVILLNPETYELKQVNIISKGNTDYPYRLFSDLCERYRKYSTTCDAKGYFSFLSQSENIPLEITESYFNSSLSCNNGILQLRLKNGRVGLCPNKFYSLNTTDIITHFSPFTLAGNPNIQASPGNFGYHRLKRLFNVIITQSYSENGIKKFVIQIHPKKDSTAMFSALAWINATEGTFEKLEYTLNTNDFYYLSPLIKGDTVNDISLSMIFIFDNSIKDRPEVTQVSLDYSLLYHSEHSDNTIRVACEGNLLLYDYLNTFPESFPKGLIEEQLNDYQKIICLPYDSLFWSLVGITPQSEKQKIFVDYFKDHGVLVNFLKSLDSLAGAEFIRWNAHSDVAWSDLRNQPPNPRTEVIDKGTFQHFQITQPPPFDMVCKLVFNPVMIGDSLHLTSLTLLNKNDSYYVHPKFPFVTSFINITFDLYEMERREIINQVNLSGKDSKLTLAEFGDIYSSGMKEVEARVKLFNKETKNGTSIEEMQKWGNFVKEKTGVDRSRLLQTSMGKASE